MTHRRASQPRTVSCPCWGRATASNRTSWEHQREAWGGREASAALFILVGVSGVLVLALKDALAVESRLCVGLRDTGVFTPEIVGCATKLFAYRLGGNKPDLSFTTSNDRFYHVLSEKRKTKKDSELRASRRPLQNQSCPFLRPRSRLPPPHDYIRALCLKIMVRPGRLRSRRRGITLQPRCFFTLARRCKIVLRLPEETFPPRCCEHNPFK